ncbi:MAG: ComEC/Rec2 family competence protein [Campylobacterota bacterium]|nr:ComEC/Rec2 family competence protein [Campylobacterota bacterium]
MVLEKPKLFLDTREFVLAMGILLAIIFFRLYLLHGEYREFISKPFYYTEATVLQQYSKSKKGKSYEVLKLRSKEGWQFYTTAKLLENLTGQSLRIKLIPDGKISFDDYLGTFFVKTRIKERRPSPESAKSDLLDLIAEQHEDPGIVSFYQAIFLATPIPKTLREQIAGLGVSHLVALSGFHLTILWGLIYGVLSLVYKPLQQRKFPYRYMLLDMGLVALGVLGFYLWFVDFPPSLVRSYAMLTIAWVMLLLGIELISFSFLGSVVMLLLALFPTLMASLGFWFSVTGVFYIYLLLHWSQKSSTWLSSKWIISMFYIPVGIFILMLPVVHGIFGVTSPWQLLSPILSLIFTLFYPLVIGLHLIGWGGMFDSSLQWLFALPSESYQSLLPTWVVIGYVLLSLGAMRSRMLFWITLGFAVLYLLYLYAFV